MKNRKAALYLRCSTIHQNLEIQQNDLRRYAEARGLQIIEEFSDFGISGAKDRRPALDQMLKTARQRKFDCVLVWRLDRLGRNTRHLLTILEELESLQIPLVSLQEGFDFSSSLGKVMATVMAALAAFERDLLRERVIAGIQNAKAKGKKLGRPPLNMEAQVQALRKSGLTFREIQEHLQVSPGTVAKYLKSFSF